MGTCSISNTGGWQTWVTKSCTISGASGIHDPILNSLVVQVSFNFNWWKFSGTGTVEPTSTQVTPTTTTSVSTTPTVEDSYVRIQNVATKLYMDGMGSTQWLKCLPI